MAQKSDEIEKLKSENKKMRLQLQNTMNQPLVQGQYNKFLHEAEAANNTSLAMTTITTQLPPGEEHHPHHPHPPHHHPPARAVKRRADVEDILDTLSMQPTLPVIASESPHYPGR